MKKLLLLSLILFSLQLTAFSQINRVKINRGSRYTRTNVVTLQIAAFDVRKMQISNYPDFRDAHWITYKPVVYGWNLKKEEGKQRVYVKFIDLKNNVTAPIDDDITLDRTAPAKGTIIIEKSEEFQADPSKPVKLKIHANDVRYMMLSNSRNFFQQRWQIYREEVSEWELKSARDGVQVVFVKFRDKAGNVSEASFDKITIDTQGPLRSSVIINNDDDFVVTAPAKVKLSLNSVGASQMRIANTKEEVSKAAWKAYNKMSDWTLSEGDGDRSVFVQFKDNAGNLSDIVTDKIFVDTTPPKDCKMVINDGEAISRHLDGIVQLELSTNKEHSAEFVMISNNKDFRGARWEIFEPPHMIITDWKLSPQNGLKTVYIKFKDAANNEGEVISAQIKLIR